MRYFETNMENSLPISSQLLTKETNAKFLFNIVAGHESISRAQLAKESGLSPSTVSVLTDEMIKNGILLEAGTGRSAPTGRKPVLLEVDPNGLLIPCFAFRPNGLLYILYDLKFRIVEQHLQPYTESLIPPKGVFITPSDEDVLALFRAALEKAQYLKRDKIRAVTISFYGAFLRSSRVFSSSVLGWYLSASVVDKLRVLFNNAPILIGNIATLSAYAEYVSHDTAKGNLLYLHLDDGVGAGIILDGHPFVGDCGIAGEIGHMLINGQRLEELVCVRTVTEELRRRFGITDLATAASALENDDPAIVDFLYEVAGYIATAINNTLCMLGSMDVFIGGALTALGPSFIEMIQVTIQQFGFRRVLPHSPIRLSNLAAHADCLGAAKTYVNNRFTVILP